MNALLSALTSTIVSGEIIDLRARLGRRSAKFVS